MAKFKIKMAPDQGRNYSQEIEAEALKAEVDPHAGLKLIGKGGVLVRYFSSGTYLQCEMEKEPEDIEALNNNLERAFHHLMREHLMREGYDFGQRKQPHPHTLVAAFRATIEASLFNECGKVRPWEEARYQDEIKLALLQVLAGHAEVHGHAQAASSPAPDTQKNPISDLLYAELVARISHLVQGEDKFVEGATASMHLTDLLRGALLDLIDRHCMPPACITATVQDLPDAIADKHLSDAKFWPHA